MGHLDLAAAFDVGATASGLNDSQQIANALANLLQSQLSSGVVCLPSGNCSVMHYVRHLYKTNCVVDSTVIMLSKELALPQALPPHGAAP